MESHFPALEADMQRYYGYDLRYALWGKEPHHPETNLLGWIGWRRLTSLVSGLPPDAAINRETEPEAYLWRTDAPSELLAAALEGIDTLRYLISHQVIDSKHHKKIPKPLSITRPGEIEPEKPKGVEGMRQFMLAMKAAEAG